ncbi:cyclin pho85 family protein [Coccidioides immitis RMSCC 2394]|uniref:Cyclin pho85 family protein n=1 Tax=Coccidioides immitis RMSCC 2394 TaxID=404692 RepID=A0A0J6YAZ0_COCIT|nr:cyclin pho85 family protein [Coccidioides immitis RMSCC 2394]
MFSDGVNRMPATSHQSFTSSSHAARPSPQPDAATSSSADAGARAASASITSSNPPRSNPPRRAPGPSSAPDEPRSSMASRSSLAPPSLPDRRRPSSQRHHSFQSSHSQQERHGDRPDAPAVTSQSSPSSPVSHPANRMSRSLGAPADTPPERIKVRDLKHIQRFASEEVLSSSREGMATRPFQNSGRQYDIRSMPVIDVIEMIAGLLNKITATNDLQHEHIHRHIPSPECVASLSPQAASVLAFHGKNTPNIGLYDYLIRIYRYCPSSYEIFLCLLVYFDRMAEIVNKGYLQNLQRRHDGKNSQRPTSPAPPLTITPGGRSSHLITPPSSGVNAPLTHSEPPSPMIQDPQQPPASNADSMQVDNNNPDYTHDHNNDDADAVDFSHYFVVDSLNIHRLVIAGITCATKYFSDAFWTNSRYSKVGGIPLRELNHIELQFLLLNDFRLSISPDELQTYATMLVEFYIREILNQRKRLQEQTQGQIPQSPPGTPQTEIRAGA